MKIEVITLQAVKNYGSVLQAFATQKILEGRNCDVTIINYIRKDVRDENLLKSWCGNNVLKKTVMVPTILKWKKIFGGFCEENLNLSEKEYTSVEDFKNYESDADAFCTGSDQVWNSKWNRGIELPLYLSFISKEKYKFSLASSFGQSKLSKEEVNAICQYINQYKFISVREDSAKKILENQFNYRNVFHVLDPTLILCADEWRKYSNNIPLIEGEYILIYNLNRSREFDRYARKLSKMTGLPLVRLCTRYDQIYRPGKSVIIPQVFDFVNLIDNAKYVLTDSFHATAFSINMNTEPICIFPNEFSGRLRSFLQMIGQEERKVKSFQDFDILNRKVDFEMTNIILEKERKKFYNYIELVMKDIELKKEKCSETKH